MLPLPFFFFLYYYRCLICDDTHYFSCHAADIFELRYVAIRYAIRCLSSCRYAADFRCAADVIFRHVAMLSLMPYHARYAVTFASFRCHAAAFLSLLHACRLPLLMLPCRHYFAYAERDTLYDVCQ